MSMHILAFFSSINSATLTQQASVADQIVPKSSSGYQVPPLNKVGLVFGIGTTLAQLQLQSPALRSQPFPTFRPVNIGAKTMSPVRAAYLWQTPLVLNPFDELDSFGNNAAGGAVNLFSFVTLFDTPPQRINGPFLHVTFTATIPASTTAWQSGPIVPAVALSVGNYAIVGCSAFSASGMAFRIIPTMGSNFRPGGNMGLINSDQFLDGQLNGGWGQWTTFNSITPPQIECFCLSGDTAIAGELTLLPM